MRDMVDGKTGSANESSSEGPPRYFKSIRFAVPGTADDVKNPRALPAKDSWIALDPGTEFELNAKTQGRVAGECSKFSSCQRELPCSVF